ncbi:MAG: lipid A biosynthesis acyltransferase [Gammaproteobacteria bacterium]|nr:lipid A biosynthesis acyltransferase [Gammaproteobacteria bacterium]MBT5332791.1 lipid A biosynthesis acyltransferase [Gammaproteobacteria bacterium]MBT5682784.1 lipid A biosynthesis acyltransferase [Gammaproteobacteria bacterium]MBT6024593.1 lipid A biosynthesis acyltransferase [Gammaproteobacteria bacterium]
MSKLAPKLSIKQWPKWFLVGCLWIVARLPMGAVFAVGRVIGFLGYHLAKSRRHITEVNIAKCFPELSAQQQKALVRENFVHTGIGAVEIALPWLNPTRDLADRFKIEGVEHLNAAHELGNGIVLVGAHYTTIDITSQPLGAFGFVDVMYRQNKNPVWESLQFNGRKAFFDGVVERSDMRQILKRLKQGRTMWYAADQDYGIKHSVFAPFFGIDTATITVTSRLASKNKSAVLMLHQFRDLKRKTWTLKFTPMLENFPSGDDLADATRLNAMLEAEVKLVPAQYLWMHRRFKTRPTGEASFYK